MHPRPFPPEIWTHVVSCLPMADKKSLLEISHFFHDITLPFVFSSVKIYVLGGYEMLGMLDTNNELFALQTERTLMHRSWEILLEIIQNTKFARLVQDVTVVVYTLEPAIFEILTLTKALGALRNLHTLRCYGTDSSEHVLSAVLQAAPPTIKHILYSTGISFDVTERLPELEHLEYRNIMYFPEDGASDFSRPFPTPNNPLKELAVNTLIHTRLKFLAIDAVWVTRIPVWIYNQLASLEITSDDPHCPINIDFICHHCTDLEEFSATGEIYSGFCSDLPAKPTLPKLQSLRLSCEGFGADSPPNDEHIIALLQFIRTHNNLRRLYLRFPHFPWRQIEPLFQEVARLQYLEVLGLHSGASELTEDALNEFMSQIPLSPRALQLSMSWDTNTGSHVPILMNTLSTMPNLKFLHIYGTYARLPLSAEELAMELNGLTKVGLTRALWDIDRSGPEIAVNKWPRWKIKFFAESDFEDPDDAWLFKYH